MVEHICQTSKPLCSVTKLKLWAREKADLWVSKRKLLVRRKATLKNSGIKIMVSLKRSLLEFGVLGSARKTDLAIGKSQLTYSKKFTKLLCAG